MAKSGSAEDRGFTLLELAVVIGVIVVLIAYATTRLAGMSDAARQKRLATELANLAEVGRLFDERGETTGGLVDLSGTRPPRLALLLPMGFTGLNPFGRAYFLSVQGGFVDVQTCACANAQEARGVTLRESSVTWSCPGPECGGACFLQLRRRNVPASGLLPLKMEKVWLYGEN